LAWPIKTIAAESALLNSSAYVLDHPNLSRKVSLALNNTNIVDALVYLSEKAEINVAVSKSVEGRATLSLNNVAIRDVLDIILLSNGLACEKRGEIFYVLPAADYEALHGEKWAEVRQVKVFKLRYAKPADVATILYTLKSNVGSVVVDNDTGTLVVMDTNEKINQMKETIDSVDSESATKVFNLQYANAKDVEVNLMPRLDTKGVGSVKADEKYNRLIVTAPLGKMDEIEKIIRQLDVKIKQVLIEAKIVRVKLTPAYEFGIDWERLLNREAATVESHFAFDSTLTRFGKIVVGKLGASNIDATLKLLKTVGETKLISSPRISALNNEEAKIFVGTKEFYTQTTTTVSTGTPTTAVAVTFIDVGVQLKVIPVINDNGFILMKILPEISRVDRTVTIATGDKIPVVDTTNAETRVMVKDGNTIIIGGLIKNETQRDTEKFPVLGDIPVIGNAFKHVREDKEKTELVVFLTPHIIGGDEDMTQFDTKKTKPMRGYDDNA
jgi:type II secretory pathway component GspD/PulD (secretin)